MCLASVCVRACVCVIVSMGALCVDSSQFILVACTRTAYTHTCGKRVSGVRQTSRLGDQFVVKSAPIREYR